MKMKIPVLQNFLHNLKFNKKNWWGQGWPWPDPSPTLLAQGQLDPGMLALAWPGPWTVYLRCLGDLHCVHPILLQALLHSR